MKRKTNSKENGKFNWMVALVVFCVCVSAPAVGIFAWRASEVMSDSDLKVLTGVLIAALLFVVNTAVLSLFLVAYSRLRRTEETEESKRELDVLRLTLGQRPEMRYNYNIKPGQPVPYQVPYGQAYPQQPTVEAPPAIQYMEGDVNLGG